MTASQYSAIRSKDQSKADANYKKNVAKAGKFQDFTAWYVKRGTSEGGNWLSSAGRGHTFAKLKYEDQSAQKNYDGANSFINFGFGKKK